jgi:glucose/arabinose dehydrogenase
MLKQLPLVLLVGLFLAPFLLLSQPKIQLAPHATGFVRPVDIAHCGDSRLFIVEQRGLIWILDSLGQRLPDTFLNIDPRVRSTGGEQGLLGLAFPPDFAQTGVFYVNYTFEPNGHTRISRFSLKPGNPNQADPNSEEILITQNQPFTNHNGGCLKFGPDGYLYIALGDGGSGGDPQNNSQTKNSLLGKFLRIDVGSTSPGLPYAIPADNPFVTDPAYRPEIWSLGWRNPWRFSFDRLTGDIWVGDVGQSEREEIDFEPANTGGRNYGWRCYEGSFTYNTSNCPPASSFINSVFDFDNNSLGCSVTGGFIYRGSKFSDLFGAYLFTDYCSGRWWATRRQTDGTFSTVQLADLANSQYATLGEDRDGELYVAALSQGTIYRINELCSAFQLSGTVINATCVGTLDGIIDLNIAGGTAPYTFNWSNGQTDSLIVYLDPGAYIVQATDGIGCIRRDTFEVEATMPVTTPDLSTLSWTAPLPEAGFLCTGDTVLLESSEAPANFGYQWYRNDQIINGATQRQYAATQPGEYTVQFDGTLCNSAKSETTTLSPVTIAAPSISVAGTTVLCSGDSILLSADAAPAGFTLQWFRNDVPLPGANGTTLTLTEGGAYTLEYQRPGCDLDPSSPVTIVEEFLSDLVELVYADDTLGVSLGVWTTYQWFLDGNAIPGATSPEFVPVQNGFYECRLTTAGGCTYFVGLQIEVVNTAIPESVAAFSLTPNPTAGEFFVRLELTRSERLTLLLTDTQQRTIFSQTHQGQRLDKKIDLQHLPAGTYFLTVQMESGSFVRRVVKR